MNLHTRLLIQKILFIIGAIFLVFLLIFGVYFYFAKYRARSKFPKVISAVKKDNLIKNGFKEIHDDQKSFFIPAKWVVTDKGLKVYGDILNGSSAYLSSTPNNLGILKEDLCGRIAKENEDKFDALDIFSDTKLQISKIAKLGDYNGCLAEYATKVNGKSFSLRQFLVFRQYNIYILTSQFLSQLDSEKQISDTIFSSLILNE